MLKGPNLVIYGCHVYNLVFGGVLLKGGCSGEEDGSDIKDPGYHSCYWGDGQGARVAVCLGGWGWLWLEHLVTEVQDQVLWMY